RPSSLRRIALRLALAFAATGTGTVPALAQISVAQMSPGQQAALAASQADFNAVRTMQGQFFQTNADGSQGAGIFVIERPGKMLFQYAPSTPGEAPPVEIISDGQYVAVIERALRSVSYVALSDTPLRLLLSGNLDL